jgi:hypothetical protein
MEEIEERFGRESELRGVEMQSLRWLIDIARRARISRIVINGSFVTDIWEPNDVDCIVLVDEQFDVDSPAAVELASGLPFLQIEVVKQEQFDYMVAEVFGSDRDRIPKGMIEVVAWE